VVLAGGAVGAGSGSGSGSTTTSRSGGSARVHIPPSPPPTRVVGRVLDHADQYVGTRYTWGGNTPTSGFDCSGFTKYVFAAQGIALPRVSRDQARAGTGIPLDFGAIRPGDLLLFAEPGAAISHVAIYVGDGQIIHSSEALGGVNYLDLAGEYGAWYRQSLVAVRRVAR
jgi:cell wall-associated NlpC family hydrolase